MEKPGAIWSRLKIRNDVPAIAIEADRYADTLDGMAQWTISTECAIALCEAANALRHASDAARRAAVHVN